MLPIFARCRVVVSDELPKVIVTGSSQVLISLFRMAAVESLMIVSSAPVSSRASFVGASGSVLSQCFGFFEALKAVFRALRASFRASFFAWRSESVGIPVFGSFPFPFDDFSPLRLGIADLLSSLRGPLLSGPPLQPCRSRS